MAFPIRFYTSTMSGAPVINNTWGSLTTALDAVLVNGFNPESVTSMTRSGSVVTVNFGVAHGYIQEQIIRVAGANEADYNGDKKVTSVPTLTSLTFAIATTPATPATGTITTLTSPLGWNILFTGTDKRVYKTLTPTASSLAFRVDNSYNAIWGASYAKFGKISAARSFLDVDTPVGSTMPVDYVSQNQVSGSGATAYNGRYKWYYARNARVDGSSNSESIAPSTYNRQWTIVGDDRGFYFIVDNENWFNMYAFTEFPSYRTGDTGNTFMMSHDWGNAASTTYTYAYDNLNSMLSADSAGKLIFTDSSNFSVPSIAYFVSVSCKIGAIRSGADTGVVYPNPATNGLNLFPCYIQEGSASIRGYLPGLNWIINNVSSAIAHNALLTFNSKTYLIVSGASVGGNNCRVAFDLTGNGSNSWY